MNGVVFQASAITMAVRAGQMADVHWMLVPRILFRMPCGSKMTPQSLAMTAVGIAHGIRIEARTRARPRKARFIISAKTMPMHGLQDHGDDVKTSVIPTEA